MNETLKIKEKYVPKKYWNKIESINVEPDFDYNKNRTYQHYFVIMTDGKKFDSSSIKELITKLKSII